MRDISLRKKAEKEIRKLSIAVEQSANAITITDIDGRIEYTNQRFTELTGYTADEVLGQIPRILQTSTHAKEFYNKLWKTIKRGKPWRGETQNKTKTNETFWEQATITPIKNKDGNITNYLYVRENITLRKKVEHALTESESRFRTIVENISDGLVIINNEGEFLSVNSAYCKIHGYSLQEILKLKVSDLLHEDNSKSFENYNEFIVKNGFWDEEVIARHKDGSKVFIYIKASVFNYNQDRAILVIVSDISERKKMEQRIYNTMIKAEEHERERYARELHDGLGPLLSTCKIYFHTLKSIDVETQREKHINRTGELLDEALTTIKEISNNLSPDILRKYGLSQAVKSFTNKLINITKTDYTIHSNLKERLPETIEFTIYRTLVELINNSVKHADASEIKINIEGNRKDLKIFFSDNGKGFDYEIVKKENKGFGLSNLKNRIIKIGGTYNYSSSTDKGVQVYITLKSIQL